MLQILLTFLNNLFGLSNDFKERKKYVFLMSIKHLQRYHFLSTDYVIIHGKHKNIFYKIWLSFKVIWTKLFVRCNIILIETDYSVELDFLCDYNFSSSAPKIISVIKRSKNDITTR